jgi:hypothetical protein
MIKTHAHIFNDDKFIDSAINLLESVYPNNSEYYILKEEGIDFQYVKTTSVKRLDFNDEKSRIDFLFKINSNINQVLFFHALESKKQYIALNCDPKIVKVWLVWGFDLYSNWELFKKNIFEEKTKKLIHYDYSYKKALIFNPISFFIFRKSIVFKKLLPEKIIKILDNNYNTNFYKSVQLMSIVAPVVPTEFSLIQKLKIKAQYAPFSYGCIEELLGSNIDQSVKGQPNVLVGNSADPSNNHLEIFLRLSKLDLKNSKIFVPLSYGGNDSYKSKIIEKGNELLGENFHPLVEFMTIEEYNQILLSCGTLIFNHVRQQGVGNIVVMVYLGAKIYMNKKSPVYAYFKRLGMTIFDLNNLNNNSINRDLEVNQFNLNRELIFSLYSKQNVMIKIKELFSIVDFYNK